VIGAAVAIALGSSAARAEFSPQVIAGISHTDNIGLTSVDEDSELIYRLEPSFHFAKEATAVTIAADYRLQALRYRDFGDTDVFHQYNANLHAALVPEVFFFDVGGSRSQSIVDPDRAIPSSNLPISTNRQDRDEYYAAPSFQYALGSDVAATGEYRHTWLQYEREGSQDNEQDDASFALDNYRKEHGLTWALRYNWQRTEYELEIPWEYQKAMAELGFWAGPNTRLFAAGGKESAWDMPLDSKLQDGIWEAGFSHQVGEHLSAELAAGERSFGSSWRGNLELTFRHGSTSLSYRETPTTQGRIRYRRGAFDGPEVPDDFLSRPGSTERFIAKRLEWRLNVELRRTALALSLFDSDRQERTEADGTPLPDESQRGANVVISYDIGARTDLRLGGSWAERELQSRAKSQLTRVSLGAGYQLGPRTALSLTYAYAEEDPEGGFTIREYVANTVSLDVIRTF
jgi:hypothetical protein